MLACRAGKLVVGLAALGMFTIAAAASADADGRRKMEARLNGFQEVPANASPGTGRFEARVEGNQINFRLSYANVTGTPTMAHIHLGQRGVNGGIFIFLCGGTTRPACPPAPAVIEGTITAADVLAIPTQNMAAGDFAGALRVIRHGVTYVNVHTPNSPAGEIRGAIRPDYDLSGWD